MKQNSDLAFKSVGFEWLEDIPNHWGMSRLKSVADLIMGQSPSSGDCSDTPSGLPFLQGCAEFGDIHPNPEQFCLAPPRVVLAGTILMSVRAPVGRLNVADQDYGIGRGLCGIIPNGVTLFDDFAYYQLQVMEDALRLVSTGSTYEAVSTGDVGGQVVAIPTPTEQIAIAAYLDHADQMLRGGVSQKLELVELMEEYKRAVIQQAITRGLDPDVPLKPSGVEWLGEIPEHWDASQVKRHYSIQLGKMLQNTASEPSDTEVPYLKAQHVQWFAVEENDPPTMWASPRDIVQFGICSGDLLVCEGGEGGRAGLVKDIAPGCIIQNALHRVRPLTESKNEYLQYVMSAIASTGWFEAINNKATIAHFTAEKFGALVIPIPPPPEQVAIVAHLDRLTSDIDAAIAHTRREIELLEEYRTRLIADVVTGKLDVREAAADLPDVNLDDIQPLAEGDEAND